MIEPEILAPLEKLDLLSISATSTKEQGIHSSKLWFWWLFVDFSTPMSTRTFSGIILKETRTHKLGYVWHKAILMNDMID